MKKLAARDFEDLLQVNLFSLTKCCGGDCIPMQCAIPCFEGLLEEPHNRRVMKLLYRTAEWHALAKLRMHSDSTLDLLEELTSEFGKLIRQFRDLTCSEFATVELPRETAARNRRQAQKQASTPSSSSLDPNPTRTEVHATLDPWPTPNTTQLEVLPVPSTSTLQRKPFGQ